MCVALLPNMICMQSDAGSCKRLVQVGVTGKPHPQIDDTQVVTPCITNMIVIVTTRPSHACPLGFQGQYDPSFSE